MDQTKAPRVSVIVPCYNLGEYIDEAINSVQTQTYTDWEIVIVDDGSTDKETLATLARIKSEHPEYAVVRQANAGVSATMNTGIKKAKGHSIVVFSADDALAPDYLKKTVAVLEKDTEEKIGFVSTWLQEFGLRRDVWRGGDFDVPRLLVENVAHAASMFRKDTWQAVGGFQENRKLRYEDWDFWLKLVERGYRWTVVPEPLFYYRIRPESRLAQSGERHAETYAMLYEYHKDLFTKYAAEYAGIVGKKIGELHNVIAEKNALLADANSRLYEQTQALIKQTEELGALKNSWLVGKAVRLRAFVGRMRGRAGAVRTRLGRVLHTVRVIGAPFVPRPVRKGVKALYRMVKFRTLHPYPTIYWADNERWDHKRPLVSVVVSYYNRAHTIDETITSLQAQTFTDFEVVIVDDGSSDSESVKKIETLKPRGLSVRIIRQENQGVAAARNTGVARARGKYIVCLDSDDTLEPTYLEKAVVVLEANPDVALATFHQQMFGAMNEIHFKRGYDPLAIIEDNMVVCAAMFRKTAWEVAGGYKSNLGYEDWEYWISLAEHGFWGRLIPEPLFRYRTAVVSRYVEDKSKHKQNMRSIRKLHPHFARNVRSQLAKRALKEVHTTPQTAFVNLDDTHTYRAAPSKRPNVLITVPWMTFGGAETLIYNFCREIKDDFNISFVTGLKSDNEWEHKFKEITPNIYHLANLFSEDDRAMRLEFVSNYIKTRDIDVLHIVHNGFVFEMLEELKRRHPKLKVVVTVFNDLAPYLVESTRFEEYIDGFSTDNSRVAKKYRSILSANADIAVIPNGVDCYKVFNPQLTNRREVRKKLKLDDNDLAVFYVGRLSSEKNPDVFVAASQKIAQSHRKSRAKFFLIGDGPMKPQIESMLRHKDSRAVTYLGYQSDVASFLSAADIFVLPSLAEGFPSVILEAMAMNVVVVASDVGAVADVVRQGRNGFVVSPGSAPEIAEHIIKLDESRELLQSMKRDSRADVEARYSTVVLGKNYSILYRRLLSGKTTEDTLTERRIDRIAKLKEEGVTKA